MSRYDMKFKKYVVELIIKGGNPIKDISQRYEISISTLYRWKIEYELYGNSSFINHNFK